MALKISKIALRMFISTLVASEILRFVAGFEYMEAISLRILNNSGFSIFAYSLNQDGIVCLTYASSNGIILPSEKSMIASDISSPVK